MRKIKAAIFISGRGSNMMALVEAAKAPDFPAEFVLVVSNDPAASGLEWAAAHGLKTLPSITSHTAKTARPMNG